MRREVGKQEARNAGKQGSREIRSSRRNLTNAAAALDFLSRTCAADLRGGDCCRPAAAGGICGAA